jgi:hypothetical protein
VFYRLIAISVLAISLKIIDNFPQVRVSAKIAICRLLKLQIRSAMSTYLRFIPVQKTVISIKQYLLMLINI